MSEELDYKKLLEDVLSSEYVKDYINGVLKAISEGEMAVGSTPYGFGEGCYYESHRTLVKEAICQFFLEDLEDLVKIEELGKHLLKCTKGYFESEICDLKELLSNYDGRDITLRYDIENEINDVRKEVEGELEKLSDEEIEKVIEEAKKSAESNSLEM